MIRVIKQVICLFFLQLLIVNAQTSQKKVHIQELPMINLAKNVSLHFISPEPIQFVDLSSNNLVGDLPAEQIARIKIDKDTKEKEVTITDSTRSFKKIEKEKYYDGEDLGVITVVGQSFMAQYRLVYSSGKRNVVSNIQIQPEDMQPLEYSTIKLSSFELKKICKKIELGKNKKAIRSKKSSKLKMSLNNVYVVDDYIFVDLSVSNKTNISYSIDDIKFSIEDKKIYKATNNQSIFLKPIYKYNNQRGFKKNYRNIFVFKKFTFPNSKVLNIRFVEKQISGRTIEMKVKYSDVLNADSI